MNRRPPAPKAGALAKLSYTPNTDAPAAPTPSYACARRAGKGKARPDRLAGGATPAAAGRIFEYLLN